MKLRALCLIVGLVLAACAPTLKPPGAPNGEARIEGDFLIARDGAKLPWHAWVPDGPVRAVVLGLHGFNDYGMAFALPAPRFVEAGVAVYAYDQRGFGGAPNRGYWPGTAALVRDAAMAVETLHARWPHTPLYLMGESMGGAVAMVLMAGDVPGTEGIADLVDGVILVAPAVWGGDAFGTLKRVALEIAAHTVPWYTVTGEGLDILPSDNLEMLRAFSRDPKVIKETRIDTIHGLMDLMDAAVAAASEFTAPALILYGLKDEVIPKAPTLSALEALPEPPAGRWRVVVYDDGYHMLLRDLQAERVVDDVLTWIADPEADLQSGGETALATLRESLED